ncbi:hypothetical protein GNY23_02305 [Labilibaculum sp. 44]|uniref:Uncharacterized protein n=1 Tax=Labilibaculum euxinus TaxID=2686357 RepID=A0A7M4D1W9_9BACT|nr:hypothetical protein [Labilibaculum euxinus]MVB05853.1 hypothetical protein [Labilibaculum euxinus]
MGNNPMMNIDEDGEFFIEAMLIGGLINTLLNSKKIDSFWDGLGYFSVGAAAGALTAGMSGAAWSAMQGLGLNGFAMGMAPAVTGIGEGIVVGAAGGFGGGLISGAGNSWLGGANFGEGLGAGLGAGISGAVTGGIIGGVNVGIQQLRMRSEFNKSLELEDSGIELDGKKVVYSQENAKRFSKAVFGDVEGLDNLYINKNPNAKKYLLKDGNIFNNRTKVYAGGVTNISRKLGDGYSSNVYLSKSAFQSKFKLYLTLGHEYVHVTHYSYPGLQDMFRSQFASFSEHAAYKWTWEASQKLIQYNPKTLYFDNMNKYSSHFLFDWTADLIKHHKFLP